MKQTLSATLTALDAFNIVSRTIFTADPLHSANLFYRIRGPRTVPGKAWPRSCGLWLTIIGGGPLNCVHDNAGSYANSHPDAAAAPRAVTPPRAIITANAGPRRVAELSRRRGHSKEKKRNSKQSGDGSV
jgi:hypothetical protein